MQGCNFVPMDRFDFAARSQTSTIYLVLLATTPADISEPFVPRDPAELAARDMAGSSATARQGSFQLLA